MRAAAPSPRRSTGCRTSSSYAQDFEKGGEDRAYALYVLARNGRAPIGELRYYADTRLDRFSTPLAKAQLGAALAMLGDKERAETAFKAALADSMAEGADDVTARTTTARGLRDGAALVTLAAETGVAQVETPQLVNVLAKAYRRAATPRRRSRRGCCSPRRRSATRPRTTKLDRQRRAAQGRDRAQRLRGRARSRAHITNDGDAPVDAVVTVIGAALTPEPAVARASRSSARYYTLDGKKVDLESARGRHGRAQPERSPRRRASRSKRRRQGGRVLLVDRLPAGLEIENPRLVDSGDIKTLDWLKTTVKPEHTEFRDDRFVAAFNFFGPGERQRRRSRPKAMTTTARRACEAAEGPSTATVAYIVRAVTPGTFVHPAATIEDMYRPERYARTAAGTLT